MSNIEQWEIEEVMLRYGGSFVRTLGELMRKADPENKRRLVATFPEYMDEYRDVAERVAKNKAEVSR